MRHKKKMRQVCLRCILPSLLIKNGFAMSLLSSLSFLVVYRILPSSDSKTSKPLVLQTHVRPTTCAEHRRACLSLYP